jgi:YVTN family beta-propeller protein
MAVNTVTNKIYVANYVSGNVTIIDGATNSTATVTAGLRPVAVAVNEATNKIHVANHGSALQQGGDPGGRKAWPDELYGDCHRRFRFCPAHDNGGGHGPMNSSYSLKTCLGVVWPTFPVGGS